VTAIRVLIADDHAVVRQGLRTFLELQEDVEVVGDVADGEQAVAAVVDLAPDVVLMDLVMPGVDGVEAIGRIARRSPATRVIALTSFLDDDKVLPAVRAGAAGYLLKDVGPDDLVRAIRTVHAGEALLHPAVAARLMEEVAGPRARGAEDGAGLTARERDVLTQIACGLSNKRIARELGISEATVKVHVSNVLRKLGVTDRTQAALHAVREGLVDER
jgi:NarL family two-component system response regulator LiaR